MPCPYLFCFQLSQLLKRATLRFGLQCGLAVALRIERFILNSEVEIVVITNPSKSADLEVEPYRKEMVVAFVAAGHPLAKKQQLSLADVAQVPLIIRRRGRLAKTRQYLDQIEKKRFQLNILMECESAEAVKIATMKGMGMGIAYRDHVESEVQKGEIKILKIPGVKRADAQSFVVYQKDRPLSPNAKDFLHLLKQIH